MPRSAKLAKDDDGKVLADLSKPNSSGAKLRNFLDRIHEVQSNIDAVMNKAKLACEPHREDIKEICREASEAGFSAKEFKTLVRKERLDHRLENIAENLDDAQKERFEDMLAALAVLKEQMGDLGAAALDAAQKGGAEAHAA